MMRKLLFLAMLIAFAIGLNACDKPKGDDTKAEKVEKAEEKKPVDESGKTDGPVKLEFYVMSQCPFGVKVEDAIIPALEKFGDAVDFHLDYIVTPMPDGSFKSLHGEKEVKGNIVQLCVEQMNKDKWLDFVACQNKDYRNVHTNWKDCAEKNGIDVAKLETCLTGEEGKKLLKASAELAKKRNARGSPTIYLNNSKYAGGRTTTDFMRAICNEFKSSARPKACADIPEPKTVNLTVLSDKRCDKCEGQVKGIAGKLKSMFPGLEYDVMYYGTEKGKKFYKDNQLTLLPSFLFHANVKEEAAGYNRIKRWLKEKGEYLELATGSKFDPTAEICDNKKDDTGNGKVDCEDETCKQQLICRKEIPNRLDVFVMSQCPYGVKALNAMEEVLKNFDNKINFHVNFIATKQPDGSFKALHGKPEVDENIRELCAIKHYPKDYKYMDYILCRNKSIRSPKWEECTGDNGIKTDVIKKCFEGEEGKKLLEENIKIANALGVTGSPTWLANNKFKFSGIDAERIKSNFCKHNEGFKGCENTLSKKNNSSTGGAQCQ